MRRFLSVIIGIGMAIAWSAAAGQSISAQQATFDDYIHLLQDNGYIAYAFDISKLADRKARLVFTVREYEGGKMVKDNVLPWEPSFYNMTRLSDIPEEHRQGFIDEGLDDPERGIATLARRIVISVMPDKADSTKRFMITVDGMGSAMNSLPLKPQTDRTGKQFYAYNTRPFAVDKAPAQGYVPLALLGSVWYDERVGVHRFCGEVEIDPDLDKEGSMTHFIPHFYVFGVDIQPVD